MERITGDKRLVIFMSDIDQKEGATRIENLRRVIPNDISIVLVELKEIYHIGQFKDMITNEKKG